MEAIRLRQLQDGAAYEHLFPKAKGNVYTIKRNASLSDTMDQIPKVVHRSLDQTKELANVLKQKSVYDTCRSIWEFVYKHIQYKKDQQGYEQIRSPARAWHDRRQGVDCDCYSVFISTVLVNLRIPHILRITKYRQAHFQHIYPVVPYKGREIILDCVTDQFDYEVPYSAKKDYPMELQFLDGVPNLYADPNDIYLIGLDGDMDELGKLINKTMMAKKLAKLPVKNVAMPPVVVNKVPAKKAALFQKVKAKIEEAKANPPAAPLPAPKPKKKGFFKKVLNVVNKVNPATVLLRNGVLAAMKLNVKNVAGRLRWSYVSPDKAAAKGIEPAKLQKLIAARQKLENIFYGAGGKPDNLRKAILGGKGNKDKAVNGLGMLAVNTEYLGVYTPLEELLGPEIYHSENIEGLDGLNAIDGLGELGEPVTLASVGAAMGVISAIVASLKQIGNIFKGKQEGSEDFDEKLNEAAENNQPVQDATPLPVSTPVPTIATHPILQQSTAQSTNPLPDYVSKENNTAPDTDYNSLPTVTNNDSYEEDSSLLPAPTQSKTTLPVQNTDTPTENTGAAPDKKDFWNNNKNWLKPTLIAGGGIAIIAIGYRLMNNNKKPVNKTQGLSGLPRHRKKKKNHHRNQNRRHKIAVALL